MRSSRRTPKSNRGYLPAIHWGGLTASGYADLPVLSVFGDTDGVLNKALYEARKEWSPKDFEEHILPGANHAGFGDYGKQPRDNDATISAEEQRAKTAEIILDWLDRHTANGGTNE